MQRTTGVTFDAQCDLAAVVYGPDDDPDRLFIDFADDLSRSDPIGPRDVFAERQACDVDLRAIHANASRGCGRGRLADRRDFELEPRRLR